MSKPLHTWKIVVTTPQSVLNATPSIPASTWKIAVTIPLSVLNATPRIPALVWVTQAIQK